MKKEKWISLLIAAFMVFSAGAVSAAPAKSKGSGTMEPFSLELTALKGKEQTDLYVDVQPKVDGYNAPDTLKKIQLKSFDAQTQELVYTKNFNEDTSSPNGKATLMLTDVDRLQPLKTMVHIKNDQTKNEVIVEGQTIVKLRPDLTVDSIESPTEVQPNIPFNVSSILKELNGDVGSRAKVELLNGDEVLDYAEDVNVGAGSDRGVALLPTLTEPGEYSLTVRISGATPSEYDTDNNEKSFTVKVVEPNKPLDYYSSYSNNEWNYQREYYTSYDIQPYYNEEWVDHYESFYVSAWTPDKINPNGNISIKVHNENGEVDTVNVALNHYYNYYWWGWDPETNTSVNVYDYYGGSQVNISRHAGDWHYSYNYTNGYEYTYTYDKYGKFINAMSKIGAELDLESIDGSHYGGKLEYNINTDTNSYDNWYYGWDGYRYHYIDSYSNSYGWGSGTTVWD